MQQCNPYAFELYSKSQNYPVLCNNKLVAVSSPSNSTTDFCTVTWNTCKDIAIPTSPFAASHALGTKLTDSYGSAADFCTTAGGSATDETVCFNGGMSVGFNATQPAPAPQGICMEKLFNNSYTNFVPHPDGSNRVFLGTQSGKIYLATVPSQGSGKPLDVDLANPFIDLTDVVHYDNQFGLMGFTFHPYFSTNGRFFVSYNCDKSKSAACSGRCACNSEINCNTTKLGSDKGALPCQYHAVVAEYTVNGTAASPNTAKTANPTEVLRIFTMGLPYTTQHAGQIYFGPDGNLYFMMGDGGGGGDPWNFAQNKKSVLGKTLRINVDIMPILTVVLFLQISARDEAANLTLWGNYTIPRDNPYYTDNTFRPEVYSYGHRNPWRCSFDAERPTYLFCADTSEVTYQRINLIEKGGNYGWRLYEGFNLYMPQWAPGPNISLDSVDVIFPVMGYNRSEVNNNLGSAAIVAGYIYRGDTDPCLYGRFIYGDLYGNDMWAAAETPLSSGNFSNDRTTFTCSKTSPISCDYSGNSTLPSLGYIFSFGQDNNKDIFYITSKGVYRIVRPSMCNYTCPLEKANTLTPSSPPPTALAVQQPSSGFRADSPVLLVFVSLFILLVLRF
ncbi:HIPL1 protein [Rhynchospora pubera]|uniref:HIPL1 protein n=1 Tax=Rhynchospora pubera TaxID=906938 RepID=A0AAV8HDY8_9POAL|nr:HIPL1 protein [Rhynchospora pubera]